MELSDYTNEQLKAELKRRSDIRRAEQAAVDRCKHCVHCIPNEFMNSCKCAVRKYGKRNYNYTVSLSRKSCELFERINGD